jgi:Tol biopolymer transport system component
MPFRRAVFTAVASAAAALAVVDSASATPPGSNGAIAWTRLSRQAPPRVVVAAADGSGAHVVFAGRARSTLEPAFSPVDPNVLFFARGINRPYSEDLFRGDLTTGAATMIVRTTGADFAPTVSPDGTRVAYFTAPRPRRITRTAVGAPERVYVAAPDGSGRRALTPPGKRSFDPDWSPDGTRLVYDEVRIRGRQAGNRIMVMDADGTGRRALTSYGGVDEVNPKWMPDGRSIVFERIRDGGDHSDIAALDVATGAQRTILATAAWETNPIPSPDGTRIVFSSDRDHRGRERVSAGVELYTMAPDGTGITRLTTNRSPDVFPDWQRLP